MGRWTKYNNPSRKRRKRRLSHDDRTAMAVKEMIIDRRLGYEIEPSYYEQKWNLKGDK